MITQRRLLPALSAGILAGLLALGGCARTTPDPTADLPAFAVDDPDVTLVEPGSDPRLLRFHESATDEPWATTVSVGTAIDQHVGSDTAGAPQAPGDAELDRVSLPLEVTSVPAPEPGDGETAAEFRVDIDAGAGTHSDPELAQETAAAQGFAMSWRTAGSGEVDTLKLLAPPESPETGRSIVESTLLAITSTNVVFPEEPVGQGGSWTVSNRITGNAAMVRTTTYTVTGIDGDTITLNVDVTERPAEDRLTIDNEVAGQLNGTTLEVESTQTLTTGRITVDLARPLPVAGDVSATTRVVYAGPESAAHITQDITTAVTYGG